MVLCGSCVCAAGPACIPYPILLCQLPGPALKTASPVKLDLCMHLGEGVALGMGRVGWEMVFVAGWDGFLMQGYWCAFVCAAKAKAPHSLTSRRAGGSLFTS